MTTSRRGQILARSAELFAAHGFHGVSINDVGAACGISGPALYRHFASKDAMLAEMLVSISERLLSVGRQRLAESESPEESLRALIGWHTEFALEHKPLIVVQERDWAQLPDDARQQVRRSQSAYVALWVDEVCRLRPGLDRRRSEAGVHAVFGLLNSTPHSARLSKARMRTMLEAMAWSALADVQA
ncbi:MAG: TetR/AcrR family transcriptional regulator [Propionibacteriales bacterium]|nr:TetR/AcrR family transcriptional regulator [Propionibacteriales bacterium]